MTKASICTIGDEILIGQIVDTNSSHIARSLGEIGIRTDRMVSIADNEDDIIGTLRAELGRNDIVLTTGGLGPTKDDITKAALAKLSGSREMVRDEAQEAIVRRILHSRGLDVLESNLMQAMVPAACEVIPNRLGTAPIMVFRFSEAEFGHPATLYAMPGVPHETLGMLPDVIADIRSHNALEPITHRNLMVYGLAESALAQLIAPWEDALPADMHLAYLPNTLTGVKLRLSVFGGSETSPESRISAQIEALRKILGPSIYSEQEDRLEAVIGRLLRDRGETLSAAESCTGGEIAHLITTIPGASDYFLGSVTSYAVSVKKKVLGVPAAAIRENGVVSADVAEAMARGARRLTGSTWAVATTGLAGSEGDGINEGGTVWIAVDGPRGTVSEKRVYHNDRERNIERFSASALDLLRRCILG
ncbi:MAG: CinA family nicotinamide mononucleotide deamidase-related protein [Bacteroidales bacterium]|nr:CinA family nicotinamide mononucleotide deamidase-related protein [Bacteroidales bacterium]